MLNGRTTLIVEGEFLIALDIQRMLESLGAGQSLFARNADEAEHMDVSWPEIAIAIVELPQEDFATLALVDKLSSTGTPIVLVTTDRSRTAALPFPCVTKPVAEDYLANAVREALASTDRHD